jgi:hypothetical protein
MAQYRSDGDGREVKARKRYTCSNCGGTIDRGELYHNYHTGQQARGNWFGRAHFDCQAAWWQGDTKHMLSALVSRASDAGLGAEVLEQALRAQALLADCLVKAQKDRKKALQLSHLLQQMAQLMEIPVRAR